MSVFYYKYICQVYGIYIVKYLSLPLIYIVYTCNILDIYMVYDNHMYFLYEFVYICQSL